MKLEDITITEEYGVPTAEKDLQESLHSLLLQYGKNMTEEEKEDFINLMESTPPSQSFSLRRAPFFFCKNIQLNSLIEPSSSPLSRVKR